MHKVNEIRVICCCTKAYTPYLQAMLRTIPHAVPVTVIWVGGGVSDEAQWPHNVELIRSPQVASNFSRGLYLNIGIRSCNEKWIVLADADMLFPTCYWSAISEFAAVGCAVRCYIGLLTMKATHLIMAKQQPWESLYADYENTSHVGVHARPRLWERAVSFAARRLAPRLDIAVRMAPRRQFESILGANNPVVYARSDLERLGGYDERFTGWGWEDDDLTARGRQRGIADRRVKVIVGHLWHGALAMQEYPDYYAGIHRSAPPNYPTDWGPERPWGRCKLLTPDVSE